MTTLAGETTGQALWRRLRSPVAWCETVDVFAILTAASLPWSTSLTAIFNAAFLICMVPFLDFKAFLHSLKRPICAAPIALFLLALAGTLWSDAAWGTRFYAVGPTVKLLVIPVLLYHFERSKRGHWVFIAFLASCVLLSVMSWLVAFYPGLSLKPGDPLERGVFVKNYIDQSQEFTLCAIALAYPVVVLLRDKRYWLAGLLTALALSFFVNMAFVVVSRTALVTVPIMLAVFALLHLTWRSIAIISAVLLAGAAIAWLASPQLRKTVDTFSRDYRLYTQEKVPTSMGERLVYWQNSIQFFAQAPVAGHGTGSGYGLFDKVSKGEEWVHGVRVFPNPHNQTLHVAVQWGVIGIAVLYTIWIVHLLLFRGDGLANWIGLLVVVQNVFTSLFNSHLFDFHEGWMYVIGVGVAGGTVIRAKRSEAKMGDAVPERPLASFLPP
ncbi:MULTISPECIES: O-antigen ligase family protein [unclassified Bradyrhizobium]|uniref:O-antigen ligase family protein n=1 Tax=unclassified Bradyrhizobium TaxID=2631580 RepID=UPI001FF8F05D|nr:O-antigen ligase family protein [Bradyrhizobium sp. 84]MCK1369907.1 O-antigen ligase family protein [Bradyrhizobium sp. 49]MCK1614284.1 O-antigen ligase family protein [Bradyrhizobium sp. 163]MCK1765572.1 O-antigen ligase family protein [Bradyrhizobium sp. 136]